MNTYEHRPGRPIYVHAWRNICSDAGIYSLHIHTNPTQVKRSAQQTRDTEPMMG